MNNATRRWAPYAFGLAMLIVLLGLGMWQVERGRYKQELLSSYEGRDEVVTLEPGQFDSLLETGPLKQPSGWNYQRVRVTGRYERVPALLLDNRTHLGKAGFHLLSSFSLGEVNILVDRGWFARTFDARELARAQSVSVSPGAVPGPSVTLTGRLREPFRTVLLGPAGYPVEGATWDRPIVVQSVDLAMVTRLVGKPHLRFMLLLEDDAGDGLVRAWRPTSEMGPHRHFGYAFTWFSLAITLAAIIVWQLSKTLRSTPSQ